VTVLIKCCALTCLARGSNPFEDLKNKKKQKLEKQQKAEQKNQVRGVSKTIDKANSAVSSAPSREKLKQDISTALSIARKSSASVGKFDKQLPNEDPLSKGQKRKFEATAPPDLSDEKNRSMKVLNKLLGKEEVLNVTKAVNYYSNNEQKKRYKANISGHKDKQTRRKGGKF